MHTCCKDLGDPLKLKARQFSRGGSSASRSAPNNLWTETPAERQQRIADEVAGKKKRAANADPDADLHGNAEDNRRKRRRDEELRKVVEEHNVRFAYLLFFNFIANFDRIFSENIAQQVTS